MGYRVTVENSTLLVTLSGWDFAMNGFRRLEIPRACISAAAVQDRFSLESEIDHRVIGMGTHNGAQRPNRRRIGTMLGRSIAGRQFWAISAGSSKEALLVLDLRNNALARVVLGIDQPEDMAALLAPAAY